jgi:ketosteroid isomerase-like protein
MIAEHSNAVACRRIADALIASDVVWHVPGAHAMAGYIRGRDQLLGWFRRLRTKGFWLTED